MTRTPSGGLALAAAALLLGLGACSAAGAPSGPAGATPTGGASSNPADPLSGQIAAGLRLSVTESGGLAGPSAVARYPDVAIYADGRVIQPGAVPAIYPGPLLPALVQTSITPAGVQAVLDLARSDGLADGDQAWPAEGVADAPDTVITVIVDGRAVTGRFGALGIESAAPSDPAAAAARAAAQAFVTALTGYPGILSADQVGASRSYVPDAVQVTAVRGDPSSAVQLSLLARPPIAWPLAGPISTFGTGTDVLPSQPPVQRCGVVSGADLQLLWPLLQQATQITGFTSDGVTWTLAPRPLLPGEAATCVGRTDQLQPAPSASTLSAWNRGRG